MNDARHPPYPLVKTLRGRSQKLGGAKSKEAKLGLLLVAHCG